MINPFTLKKPGTVLQWLARSAAWGMACLGGFALIIRGMVSMGNNTGIQALFFTGLTLAQFFVWKYAVGGFAAAMQQRPPAALAIKILAMLWLLLLVYLLVHCALLTAFGWLMLGDDGPFLRF